MKIIRISFFCEMEYGVKSEKNGNRTLIRIQYLDEKPFCDIDLDNLTEESFLRDGEATQALSEY